MLNRQSASARLSCKGANCNKIIMKVYMSHAHTDAVLAARVSNALENKGLEVWDPDRDLLPGDNWASEIGRALEEADAMVVLLTPAAASSPYVKRDIGYALGAINFSNRLIPVVVGDPDHFPANEMPWFGLDDPEADHPNVEPIAKAIFARA